ncbi:HD-GYP domain-containing protein [Clostridium sp. OS1-26]|uniref:HD-GYP domain-containing protein n=1 Tax=Clostridium sp. OS1-26 TaxID=3070681 RepID=UPI0027DF788A|nr:HD-GYP domain-containing protein [Clostridium sp. OS1-26]WML34162.1 HD-GYP domain-containing protein [Clostridium sp. OS1-26]
MKDNFISFKEGACSIYGAEDESSFGKEEHILQYVSPIIGVYIMEAEILASLLYEKDFYTWEHSKNVAFYTNIICEELHISEEEKLKIHLASILHDVGKIGIDDSILNKPDKLTVEEYEEIKKHSIIGEKITMNIEYFEDLSNIIRSHHERWDGNGYPDGLEDDEIPLASQIIAIADTFDALTSDRIYRKSISQNSAVEILIGEKGKQFNPELVDIFTDTLSIDNLIER